MTYWDFAIANPWGGTILALFFIYGLFAAFVHIIHSYAQAMLVKQLRRIEDAQTKGGKTANGCSKDCDPTGRGSGGNRSH